MTKGEVLMVEEHVYYEASVFIAVALHAKLLQFETPTRR